MGRFRAGAPLFDGLNGAAVSLLRGWLWLPI